MFSPFFHWSRRFGDGDPLRHCCLHVALYRTGTSPAPKRWCMTEHGSAALWRDRHSLRIGRSALRLQGDALRIEIDERTMPLQQRVRGTVLVHPQTSTGFEAVLSETGDHRWTPLSPRAHVEVSLSDPDLRWSGDGYLDGNHGASAIETAFRRWNWCRAPRGAGAAILYEAERRDGAHTALALGVDRHGTVTAIETPQAAGLERSHWGVARDTRSEDGWARTLRTMVDSPFYTRALIETRLGGERGPAVHETLDCDRFRAWPVQAMLPFRVGRALRRG